MELFDILKKRKKNEVLCGVALGYSKDTAPHGARALAKNVHFCE